MADTFNLAVFRKIVSAALLSGVLAGLLLTGVQRVQVIPALLQAEVYEAQAAEAAPAGHVHDLAEHGHEHAVAAEHEHVAATAEHHHDPDAWKPANGWERTFYTAVANISLAIGFALLLGAAISFRGGVSGWHSGLLWGLAGYAVFFVAPSLGLPPEVPGAETARLFDRQLWWFLTVLATAGGLALLVFSRTELVKAAGGVLLLVPHLIGAPQPQIHGSAAPEELAHAFVSAAILANAIFWLALGSLTALFYKKMA